MTTQQYQHYEKAPIMEAVIDIRIVQPAGLAVEALKEVFLGQTDLCPTPEDMHTNIAQMMLGPKPSTAVSAQHTGFLFRSVDAKQIVQARLDGFTISRLQPYQDWETFSASAKRFWNLYRSVAVPTHILRLAMRYINRFDIPLPVNDFKDYFRTVPEVSPDLPQGLTGFLMQIKMPLEDSHSEATITETIIPQVVPDFVPVLLDIDISRTSELTVDETRIWEIF